MPTYLCHGFRWTRRLIRIFVVLENIDDAAPDWVIRRGSSRAILERLGTKFDFLPRRIAKQPSPAERQQQQQRPKQREKKQQQKKHQDDDLSVPPSRVPDSEDDVLANDWSPVKLLEEYDPEEMAVSARPFAYVANYAVRVDLSASIAGEMAKHEALVRERNEGDWFERLRDELQEGEPIGWYVVVCGDEERAAPGPLVSRDDYEATDDDHDDDDEEHEDRGQQPAVGSPSPQPRTKDRQQPSLRHKMSRAGLRRLFGKKDAD